MKRWIKMSAALVVSTPLSALAWDDFESMTLANALGTVLASESRCTLTYNQDAIAAFIEQSVPASDLNFAPMLNTMTMGQELQFEEMSESSQTAHCAAVKQSAKHFGFIE